MSTWTFLTAFARDPVRIGAIAPSGRALARLEVQAADIRPGHSVVELGAGTGPMTAELVRRHPDAPLLVLEPDATLAALLREKFPDLRIEERFAQALPELVADWGHGPVDRVVSSLPWAIWPETLQTAVFDGIHAVLASDAFFPFRDGVDAAAEAGARAIVQPGGSMRDDEVIEAANEHGMAMVFTGQRLFRH